MGINLSKKRQNKRDSSTQTKIQGKHINYAINIGALKRCSTLATEESQSIPTTPIKAFAAVKKPNESPSPAPPQSKRPKYDPIYTLWKNAFEDNKLRSPRKVSPIKGENSPHQNITGVVAGQLTPKGFPLYTELIEGRNNHGEMKGECNNNENSPIRVCRRLSFKKYIHCRRPIKAPSLNGDERNTRKNTETKLCENTVTNSPHFEYKADIQNENEEEAVGENSTLIETSFSSNPEYTSQFLAMIANEKAMVIQKFFKKLKQSRSRESDKCRSGIAILPKCRKPLVSRRALLTPASRSPIYWNNSANQQTEICV